MAIPATQLSQNQFALTPVQGELDLRFNPSVISAAVDVSSLGSLIPGQAVKRVDSAGGVPKIVECALNSDDIYGFINFDIKHQVFNALDMVEISAYRGSVMYMTSSAAISANADVAIVVSGSQIVTATSGMRKIGRALDKATAAGQLIRVMIDLPGALA